MSHAVSPPTRAWILGPWWDALLLANLAWPLVFLIACAGTGFDGRAGLQFWQINFVTTPHRWLTLLVVLLDRQRLRERPLVFAGIAAGVVAVCVGTLLTTGALTCLLAVDYVWNAWHFAAQHHGIYRLYLHRSGWRPTGGLAVDKLLLRGFLLYVTLRVAGGTWSLAELEVWLRRCDWLAPLAPVWLLIAEWRRPISVAAGGQLYLTSVCGLYLALLAAVHLQQPGLVLALATASALFHAVEYLALMGWSVQQRSAAHGDQLGWLHWCAGAGAVLLLAYIIAFGVGGWLIEQQWFEAWLLLNVIAAFLHYAYDGLIWRRPRQGVAASRGRA